MNHQRRRLVIAAAGAPALATLGCATGARPAPLGRVVVVGAGFGGATAARYIRRWEPRADVTLVERDADFVSCPLSNLVLGGWRTLDSLTRSHAGLQRSGVQVVHDEATAVDTDRRQLRLARGAPLPWDRLILAPGVDFQTGRIAGLQAAADAGRVLHAWKAGPQTLALRAQLQAMKDGGVCAITIPRAPYRCPPGPYERASLIARYFQQHKPRSKVLVLDANPDLVSKKGLFLKAWQELYPGLIEYRPNSEIIGYDAATGTAKLQLEDVRADVLNVIPPQHAGRIAAPFITVNGQWVGVEYQGFESTVAPGVHVLGDAIAPAPGMPKSAFMANNQAKVVAAAVVARLNGQPVDAAPILANTCWSFVSETEAIHVASLHKWDAVQKTLAPVAGAGGLSAARNAAEGAYALSWAASIWADALG